MKQLRDKIYVEDRCMVMVLIFGLTSHTRKSVHSFLGILVGLEDHSLTTQSFRLKLYKFNDQMVEFFIVRRFCLIRMHTSFEEIILFLN